MIKELTDKEKTLMASRMSQVQQPQISVDALKNATNMQCECGGMIFQQGLIIKKISAILSPTGEEIEVPIQVIFCKDCGLILPDTDKEGIIPAKIKSKKFVSPKIKLS